MTTNIAGRANASVNSAIPDPTRTERQLPIGSEAPCQCVGCGRYFRGGTAFDRHQRLDKVKGVICRDPADVGLHVVWKGGYAWWAQPITDEARAMWEAKR